MVKPWKFCPHCGTRIYDWNYCPSCGAMVGAVEEIHWPAKEEDPVELAILIIQSYQIQIAGRGLDREGFCQESFFLNAVEEIRRRDC